MHNEILFEGIDLKWIDKHPDKVDWTDICVHVKLNNKFIRKYKDWIDWKEVCMHQCLNSKTLYECQQYVYWDIVSIFQKIKQSFISEHAHFFSDELFELYLPRFQNLDDYFILNNIDRLDMSIVLKYQCLSSTTITYLIDHLTILNVAILSQYQYISPDLACSLKHKLNWNSLLINKHSCMDDMHYCHIIECLYYINQIHYIPNYSTLCIKLHEVNNAANKIQFYWKHSISNPSFKICRQRLHREFNELINNLKI